MKTIVTHNSKFHADDVFAVAVLLASLKEDAEVVRTRDKGKIAKADFVVDEGGIYDAGNNRFDHHQPGGAGGRANGIPYAAFGLVWKKFGEEISGSKNIADIIDRKLVTPTDAEDNGVTTFSVKQESGDVYPYEICDAIYSFVPTWKEAEASLDSRFMEAVLFAQKIIEREIANVRAEIEGKEIVEKTYRNSTDKRIIVLDGDYPFAETLSGFREPLYVVHPRNNSWYLECVRDNPALFLNRKDLPESWAGLRDERLAKATGVPDAIFCHTARFMAVAHSKGGTLALAREALES